MRTAQIVNLVGTNLSMFLSNEAEVLREVRAFGATRLPNCRAAVRAATDAHPWWRSAFFKGMSRVPPVIGREVADGRTWDEMWAAPVADIVVVFPNVVLVGTASVRGLDRFDASTCQFCWRASARVNGGELGQGGRKTRRPIGQHCGVEHARCGHLQDSGC